ncbi:MAG: zinc ABC transporter substrate-binding protein ZnuA [Alphaproteobacteria bacterium]|nr:zinc ABC transporter substrate-binding protein ZnuA [Alphaproteobacteria bacterium]
MRLLKTLFLSSTLLMASSVTSFADVKVVASIKPIHSLVAGVMEGVGEPDLIVDGQGSPHTFSMKPSQAQMLQSANIVFWVGHELEAFLEKPLETVGAKAISVELFDAPNLIKLGFREGGTFEKHSHAGHEEDDHDDHKEDDHADHKDDGHDDDKEHENHDDAHAGIDAHIWLDPMNAKAMVHVIKDALIAVDSDNASKYKANAEVVLGKLDTLTNEVMAELTPVKGKGYIVFHDAYQYFEKRFGVTASGSITVSPEVMPGVERITTIRARVQELGDTCLFAEPQFEPKLVGTVIEGTKAKSGVIDPLGSSLENGSDLYFNLIRNMASSIKECLSRVS